MDRLFDRRLTPFSGRIGHVSLSGQMDVQLTEGEAARIGQSLAFLRKSPQGAVDRQLLHGDAVTVIDREAGHAFVMAEKDGFCGWLAEGALAPQGPVTHHVITPMTHLYPAPKVQAEPLMALTLNAKLEVTGLEGRWAKTAQGYVPANHLAPLGQYAQDPVTVAEMLLHAPYYWGGNSVMGVDCSGLVQLAFHAAGKSIAGDSDLQALEGVEIAAGSERRGDLIFWKGHVALVAGENLILHANGHAMAVVYESLDRAIARIEAAGDGPVTHRRRL